MRWDWLRYDWLGRRMADGAYLWEFAPPRAPRSLRASPRHTSRALGQRSPEPVIRSWLGVGGSTPSPPH